MRDEKKNRNPVAVAADALYDQTSAEARLFRERLASAAIAAAGLMADRVTMLAYIDLMRRREDWHGVADAASDLREIDAKLAVLR